MLQPDQPMLQAAMSEWSRPTCGAARGRVAAGSRREAGRLREVQQASPYFLTSAFSAVTPPCSCQQPAVLLTAPACSSMAGPRRRFLFPAFSHFPSPPHPGALLPPHSPPGSPLPEGLPPSPLGVWGWQGCALASAQPQRCHVCRDEGPCLTRPAHLQSSV